MFLPRGVYKACHPSRGKLMWVPRYDEIRTLQVNYLLSVWSSGSGEASKKLHKDLDEKIDRYTAGGLNHAAEAVSSIWILSRKKETIRCTSSVYDNIEFIYSSGDEEQEHDIRTSLIKSIQGRPLLHRRYWARRSRRGSVCPVYFPCAVPTSMLSQVATCEWR